MTQTVSSDVKIQTDKKQKKYSPAVHNGLYNVKSSRTIMIINLVLHLFAAPFMQVMLMTSFDSGGTVHDFSDMVILTGILCTAAGVISGLCTATSSFRSMYDRQHMDMEFSMPMSAKSRFLSDHLSGLFVYTAPYLAAQVCSLILWGWGYIRYEGKMVGTGSYREICTFYSEYFPNLLMLIAGGLLIMIMTYVLWVLAVVCCGRMFEVVVYGLAANVVPPAIIGIVYAALLNNLVGVDYSRTISRLIGVTSPGGAVFGLTISMDDWALFGNESCYRGFWEWALLMIAVIALMFALSYFLYVRRTAEKTGQTFAYRLFYNIILGCVIFGIAAVALPAILDDADDRDTVITIGAASLIISFVIFMLMEFFANKGFSKFRRSLIKFAGFVAGSCALIIVSSKTGFFGAEYYVPSPIAVSSVQIKYSGIYGDLGNYTYTLRDKENITAVINAHSNEVEQLKAVSRMNGDADYYYGTNYVEITYVLASGRKVKRNYQLQTDSCMKLASLELSDEFKKQYTDNINADLRMLYSPADLGSIPRSGDENNDYIRSIYTISTSDKYEYSVNRTYSRLDLPEDFGTKLAESITLDMNAMTAEDYLYPTKPEYGVLRIPIYVKKGGTMAYETTVDLLVRGCFTNTKNYLESVGVFFGGYDYVGQGNMLTYRYAIGNININTYDPPYPMPVRLAGKTNTNNNSVRPEDRDTINEIIDISIRDHIIDKKCYTISVGYQTGYIPEKYSELAQYAIDYALEGHIDDYGEDDINWEMQPGY